MIEHGTRLVLRTLTVKGSKSTTSVETKEFFGATHCKDASKVAHGAVKAGTSDYHYMEPIERSVQ
jgi:hypothetical protein